MQSFPVVLQQLREMVDTFFLAKRKQFYQDKQHNGWGLVGERFAENRYNFQVGQVSRSYKGREQNKIQS